MSEDRPYSAQGREAPEASGTYASDNSPDTHGKFSLSEDWVATIAGLAILFLALFGLVPNIGEWFW